MYVGMLFLCNSEYLLGKRSPPRLVEVHQHQIIALSLDGDGVCGDFVECALPPFLEVVDGITESDAAEVACIHVDDRHLLTWKCG